MSLIANKKFRKDFQKNSVDPLAHSAWIEEYYNGDINEVANDICYVDLFKNYFCAFNKENPRKLRKLIVFFGSEHLKNKPWIKDWAKFFIEDSFFAPIFKNKSVEDGFQYGFEIDLKQDTMLVKGAMMCFRCPFEQNNFSWDVFRKMGFTDLESWALANNFCVNEGYKNVLTGELINDSIYVNYFNNQHSAIKIGVKFPAYEGKGFIPVGSPAKNNIWHDDVHSYFRYGIGKFPCHVKKNKDVNLKMTAKKLLKKMKG